MAAVGLVAAAGLTFAATPAQAVTVDKQTLVGPYTNITCVGLEPADIDISETLAGFALFKADTTKNTLSVAVNIRGAEPNTEYPVRFLQSNGDDCFIIDGTLTTRANGNGSLRLSEPITGTAAQVIIDTSELFGLPSYRASQAFVF